MPHLLSDRIPSGESKAECERRVFSAFADDIAEYFGVTVATGTITSREPPEPDIRCEVVGRGPVAFELVEILDQDAEQFRSTMMSARNELLAYPRSLSDSDFGRFEKKFATTQIKVGFRYDKPLRDLQPTVPILYDWLIHSADHRVSGDVPLPPEIQTGIEFVSFLSSSIPIIDVDFGLTIEDVPLSAVTRKLVHQSYNTDAPVELLAYSHNQPWLPHPSWISKVMQTITPLVDAAAGRGHIRRLWVYKIAERRTDQAIKLVYPRWE
jgi:hypothetical protein